MAADFIALDRSKRMADNIVRLAELVREVRELADKVGDNKDHMVDGVNFTVLESRTGASATYSGNLATLLGYIQEIFNSSANVSGADRLARLDEFVARVAGQ
jgi:hypothetical protein